MKKARYFKFLGMNGEERIIKYEGDATFGFVNGRWMAEPSLITKINGRDPDSSVVEITEKEACKIVGVKHGLKIFYYMSFLIPVVIIIAGIYIGKYAINVFIENKKEEEAVYNKTYEERLEEVIVLEENEVDVTKNYDKTTIDSLYAIIPFSSSSTKSAYQKDKNNINNLDTISLFGTMVSIYIDECSTTDEGCLFSVEKLKGKISSTYNGYNGYNALSKPLEFISSDNKYVCTLNEDDNYLCKSNNKLMKSYRVSDIVKVTEKDDELYIYEASIYVKDEYEKDNKYLYSIYRLTNGTMGITSCTLESECKELEDPFEKYKSSSVIYKHTYKKNSNGYYWYSTDLYNKL